MAWSFGRKKKRATTKTGSAPLAPRAADADQRLGEEILEWLRGHAHEPAMRGTEPAHIHLGHAAGAAPAGAVLKIKRGKLAWVDLWDPAWREPVNQLVKHLDKQQKWSFNGVIATKYEQET